MCVYKILAHSKDGYVYLCNDCNHYQLAFGTTGVSFDLSSFNEFYDNIIFMNNSAVCNGFENEKRFKLELVDSTTMMIVSFKELEGLYDIMCEAKFNMEVDDLFIELNLVTE